MITIELTKELEKALHDEAKREGISLAKMASLALQSFLDDKEDYKNGQAVLERMRKGKEKTISLGSLRHDLGY